MCSSIFPDLLQLGHMVTSAQPLCVTLGLNHRGTSSLPLSLLQGQRSLVPSGVDHTSPGTWGTVWIRTLPSSLHPLWMHRMRNKLLWLSQRFSELHLLPSPVVLKLGQITWTLLRIPVPEVSRTIKSESLRVGPRHHYFFLTPRVNPMCS